MRNKILHLDDFTESLASISKYKKEAYKGKDNNYAKMMEALKNIIVGELTERQKICTMLYYGKKNEDERNFKRAWNRHFFGFEAH